MTENRIAVVRLEFDAFGGAERVMIEQADYLESNGHDVSVFTMGINEDEFEGFCNNHNITVVKMPSLFFLPLAVFKLYLSIRDFDPDFVLTDDSAKGIVSLALEPTNIPFYLYKYDSPFWIQNDKRKYSRLYENTFKEIWRSNVGHQNNIDEKYAPSLTERLIIEAKAYLDYYGTRNAKQIFTICQQSKWEIKKMYGKDSVIVHPGVSKKWLEGRKVSAKKKQATRKKFGIDPDTKVILTVNRLSPEKRIDLLIKSYARTVGEDNESQLVIVGKGPEEFDLKTTVEELGIGNNVTFTGFVSDKELKALYSIADTLSYQLWHSWGLPPIEAISFDTKVVVCQDSGATELEEYFTEGIFISEPNCVSFAETIENALSEDTYPDRTVIQSNLTWETFFRKVGKHIKEI